MIPLGLGFGRLGNFINGELWGRPSDVPWAMVFPQSGDGLARIRPSSMSWAWKHRAVCTDVVVFSKPRPLGQVSAVFLIGYGTFRFLAATPRR